MDTGNMRINSIGVNYSGSYAQKNKRIVKQQTPIFQANKSCAKFFGISLGGLGTVGTAGLVSVLDQAVSRIDIAAISAIIGTAFAIYGYDKGKDLDKIIDDYEKDFKNPKETQEISDKK